MEEIRVVATDAAPAAIGPYSQALVHGGLLFSAGQIPLDPSELGTDIIVEFCPTPNRNERNKQAARA